MKRPQFKELTPESIALICIVCGSILRLSFPIDFEYKLDQKILIDWINEFHFQGKFRDIGMMSGGHVYNFGLGVWLFYLIGYISSSPVLVTMIVAIINILSLLFLYYIIKKYIKIDEKNTWYNALSLLSISIIPIILSRNIWIQSILPPFVFGIIYLYITRSTKFLSTSLLSFMLVLIGQIHLSGIFLLLSMTFFISIYHFKKIRQINTKGFILGGLLGFTPMIPYIKFVLAQTAQSTPNTSISNLKDLRIIWMPLFDGLGLDVFYILERYTFQFLKYPIILNHYSYLNLLIYCGIIIIALIGLYAHIRNLLRSKQFKLNFDVTTYNFTTQYILISILIYILLTLIGSMIYTHYFIISYPFIYLLVDGLLVGKKHLIRALILLNLILSVNFMFFIHKTGGFKDSYYGLTFQKEYPHLLPK